jgi:hypothetical protein
MIEAEKRATRVNRMTLNSGVARLDILIRTIVLVSRIHGIIIGRINGTIIIGIAIFLDSLYIAKPETIEPIKERPIVPSKNTIKTKNKFVLNEKLKKTRLTGMITISIIDIKEKPYKVLPINAV